MPEIKIGERRIGDAHPPLVIAEVGINHEGDIAKARRMVDDARAAGAECVKFQAHVIEDEMIPNDVVPGNARESIWDIMSRCALTEEEDRCLKQYVESQGMLYLSTPFSRAAVALGARVLEKHFTSDKSWPGPDIPISLDPAELGQLVEGSRAVFAALGGHKSVLPEEQPTIDFAYASVVAIRDIGGGELLSRDNIWVKRPGTGGIRAAAFEDLLGRVAARPISKDAQLALEGLAGASTSR